MQESAFPPFVPGIPVKSVYERAGFEINKESLDGRPSSRARNNSSSSTPSVRSKDHSQNSSLSITTNQPGLYSGYSGANTIPYSPALSTGSFVGSTLSLKAKQSYPSLPSPRLPFTPPPQSPLSDANSVYSFQNSNYHKSSHSNSSSEESNISTPHTSHSSNDSVMLPLSGLRITGTDQVPEIPPRKSSHNSIDRTLISGSRASSNHSNHHNYHNSDASSRMSSRESSRASSRMSSRTSSRADSSNASSRADSRNGHHHSRKEGSGFSSIGEHSPISTNDPYMSALSSPPISSGESIFSTANEMSSSTSSTSLENTLQQVPEEDSLEYIHQPYTAATTIDEDNMTLINNSNPKGVSTTTTKRAKRICRGCNEQIVGKCVSSQDGGVSGKWHRQCFTCHQCASPFDGEFYVLNDFPYCDLCYHVENNSICQGCGNGIEGECLETTSAPKTRTASITSLSQTTADDDDDYFKRYHPNCLSCSECKNVIGDEEYYIVQGTTLCAMHAFTYREGINTPEMEKRHTRLMMM